MSHGRGNETIAWEHQDEEEKDIVDHHLVSIPVTNTSVNPARSTGPAIFAGGAALGRPWVFWVAPVVGAAIAGLVYRMIGGEKAEAVVRSLGVKTTRRRKR